MWAFLALVGLEAFSTWAAWCVSGWRDGCCWVRRTSGRRWKESERLRDKESRLATVTLPEQEDRANGVATTLVRR
jgi:hypothetical protein